jgi:mono/diheme cytochrome c family protein
MRLLALAAILTAAVLGAFFVVTAPTRVETAELAALSGDPARGETVFWAAGCASCHAADDATGEGRLVLSGGQRFTSDFGTFVAPNVSMDAEHGIGAWTLADFVTAVQEGISPEGRHYYPAFPYTAYALAERQDIVDLWAFWQLLPAADAPSAPHEVSFPFTIRRGIGLWNALNMPGDYVLQGELTEQQARGRYLAEALAHCAECHTPRDATGGLDRSRWMAGAPDPSGRGNVPPLTPDQLRWSERDIAAYLNDGFTPDFDSAGGHMVSVIRNMAMLTEADRLAIAAYLKALPPSE